MIVVDSSVWIDLFRREQTGAVAKLKAIADPTAIIVGDVILLEILQGARDEGHAARIERELRQFLIAPMLNEAIALAAAKRYRELRRAGVTTRTTIDMIIATYCLEHHYTLLHDDRDFDLMVRHLGLVTL